ncbi:hypothetical protein B7463_g2172, partial [Scytalidium lignicola]
MAGEGEPSQVDTAEESWQTEANDTESENAAEPSRKKKKSNAGNNTSMPIRLPTFTFPPDETKTKILGVFERIQQCHVNQDIIIPELVMCGKQSAGKSSVLEAITGVEFPKGDGGPCTRFVIEIRLFPDADKSYIKSKVRFRPLRLTLKDRQEGKISTEEVVQLPDHTDINKIMAEAKRAMGITDENKFSPHVLSIEYHFPDPQGRVSAPRLTLIDLPGLTAVDEKYDLVGVTRRYIERESAIILAVVDAVDDIETHEIIKIAKAEGVDPEGRRTFGIITKPDMVSPESNLESVWVQEVLLQPGSARWFRLGSHVLCNRSSDQTQQDTNYVDLENRDKQEKILFARSERPVQSVLHSGDFRMRQNGWHKLYNANYWGVESLRHRLLSLLSDMAVRQLDSIYNSIEVASKVLKEKLKQLEGVSPEKQKIAFSRTIYELRRIAYEASTANYTKKGFFTISRDGPFWLRSKIVGESAKFTEKMRQNGHDSSRFSWKPDEKFPTDHFGSEVTQMLEFLHRTQSGSHVGEFNPDRVHLVLQEFSKPWNALASDYVEKCHSCCVDFAREAVRYSVTNAGLAERYLAIEILWRLGDRRDAALAALGLLEEDRGDVMFSMSPSLWVGNRELIGEMSKALGRKAEPKEQMPTSNPIRSGEEKSGPGTQAKQEFGELDLVSRVNALKLLHNLLRLYKQCRATYIDNLLVQVVQRNLLRDFESLFTHGWMEDKTQFAKIMEDPDNQGYLKKIAKLKEEADILDWALNELRPLLGKFSFVTG